MSEVERVLEANESFYRAFASGDVGALEALFADGDGVATAHPWRPPRHGREAVVDGWRAIVGAGAPPIRPISPQVSLLGDCAVLTCIEDTGGDPCVATNVFVRQDGSWRLAHHHGAPLAPVYLPEVGDGSVH